MLQEIREGSSACSSPDRPLELFAIYIPYAGQDLCHDAVVFSLLAMAESALDKAKLAVIFP
jgi:hypothetical protein